LEEITFNFRENNTRIEEQKQEAAQIFHILTGMADTFVLLLENVALDKVINDSREELRRMMVKVIPKNEDETTYHKPESRNYPKIGMRLSKTSSSKYRIHSKKLINRGKERKMFIEDLIVSNKINPDQDEFEDMDKLVFPSLVTSNISYKGDIFEMMSLNSFKAKIVETLEKTNFPWRALVKKSIKAIESLRKKQPKIGGKSVKATADWS